jgi:hypothetical protein
MASIQRSYSLPSKGSDQPLLKAIFSRARGKGPSPMKPRSR